MFSDCRSAIETIQAEKTRLTQEIKSLLFSTEATGKSYTLQWIPAHVDIEGKKLADSLANEARTIEPVPLSTTVFDGNAVAREKLCSNPPRNLSLPELNYSREITTTTARLRTKKFKDMNILLDGSRIYVECEHYPGTQLDPKTLFWLPFHCSHPLQN